MDGSNPLEDLIRAQIAADGPMDIGTFMNIALAHPQYGYYMTRDPFGVTGDFITAPEISQMFGELIGAWVADIWAQMGRPARFIWLECGPGRGTLMADALRATRRIAGFHQAAQIVLMEMSPVLQEKQRATLAGYGPVSWIAGLDDLDDLVIGASGCPVICIANEFLDALPVRQFVKQGAAWHERVVGIADGVLAFGLSPPVAPPVRADNGDLADGVYEIAPARNAFVRQLAALVAGRGGAALLVDYGYERSAAGDTLQAVKDHEFINPLEQVGLADITSHVDFQAIAQAGNLCAVHGPRTQGDFLRALGIGVRAEMLRRQGGSDAIEGAMARLCDEAGMGQLFKVLALTQDDDIVVAGF